MSPFTRENKLLLLFDFYQTGNALTKVKVANIKLYENQFNRSGINILVTRGQTFLVKITCDLFQLQTRLKRVNKKLIFNNTTELEDSK